MSKYGRFNFDSAYAVNPGPIGDQAEGELYRLRRELAALKETLADRETALANAALDAQQSRERWQQEIQHALSDAEQAWKAEEAARFAAAEAQWRQQSADAVAEATARDEAAELKVEQLGRDAELIADAASTEATAPYEATEPMAEQQARATESIADAAAPKATKPAAKFEDFISQAQSERVHRAQEARIVLRPDRIWLNEAAE